MENIVGNDSPYYEYTGKCHFCNLTAPSSETCRDTSRNRFRCTRELGHNGPHVACGHISHSMKVWKNEKDTI